MHTTKILTDDSSRELLSHGTTDFPFAYYYDDIHASDRHCIAYHWHSEFEWCMVESGTVDCIIDSERIRLCQGDGIFINSKVIHGFESECGARMPNIVFSPQMIAPAASAIYIENILPILNSGCAYYVFRERNETEHDILKILKGIFHLAAEASISKMDIQIAVSILWRDFIKETDGHWNHQKDKRNTLLQSRIRTMVKFIMEHYAEKLTLTDIALTANISTSEAFRCFHRAIQTTPVKYLLGYRLNRAKQLLLTTNDTVSQIAYKVGFGDLSYFVRMFRREYGMAPGEFRVQFKTKERDA